MSEVEVSLCLPKGENMQFVSKILSAIAFPIEDYSPDNRSYRPRILREGIRAKIFAERDVVIQVASGNYSIGFCGLDWIEEFYAKFPNAGLKIWRRFGGVTKRVYACCHTGCNLKSISELNSSYDFIRIISEYVNIAEHFAIRNLWGKYHIFSIWGAVEAYPPEDAEIVVLGAKDGEQLQSLHLRPLEMILESKLCIIINQSHYESRDLSVVLDHFCKIGDHDL